MTESWLTYRCHVREDDVATVEACLEEAGALSVSCTAAKPDRLVVDLVDGARPLWSVCEVSGLFGSDSTLNDIEKIFSERRVAPLQTTITALHNRNWHESWRDQFHPQLFGERLWVCPTWEDVPDAAALIVQIDPGMAFGTGNHATTALCLEWLSMSDAVKGARVLDYGCGSGILSIAAAKLGAVDVTAIDIDDSALEVCRENVSLNGLTNISIGDPATIDGNRYDLIVANILLEPLVQLADHFRQHLLPGGQIVLSGILSEQTPSLLAACAGKYNMQAPRQRGEWALLGGVLNGP